MLPPVRGVLMGFQLFDDSPIKARQPDIPVPRPSNLVARTPTESGCYLRPDARDGATGMPRDVGAALDESGKPLSPEVRAGFESRLGADFSRVRIHDDAKAADAAASTRSLAFTAGHDIVFAPGRFAPGTRVGRELLGHELMHVIEQNRGGSLHPPSWQPLRFGAQPVGIARQPNPQPPADSARSAFLRAVERGDAIGIQLGLKDMTDAERLSLANDTAAMRRIDQRLPPAVRLRVHMQLRFGTALPAHVTNLLRAATDRDASRVASILAANISLRDPGEFPGLIPTLKTIFADDPAKLQIVSAAGVLSKQEMLAYARQSPHLAEQERQTSEAVKRAEGRDFSIGVSTEEGQTATALPASHIQIAASGGRSDFAIKYSHELSNLYRSVIGRDASGRPGSPRKDQYSSADAYATAVLEWEAWSVVDRAIVAAELNIGTDWISALGRDFKAGKITRGQMLNRVVARLAEFVTTDSSGREISARENYSRQWESAHRLSPSGTAR
jgi:Domain of unknown function (DUF4157)